MLRIALWCRSRKPRLPLAVPVVKSVECFLVSLQLLQESTAEGLEDQGPQGIQEALETVDTKSGLMHPPGCHQLETCQWQLIWADFCWLPPTRELTSDNFLPTWAKLRASPAVQLRASTLAFNLQHTLNPFPAISITGLGRGSTALSPVCRICNLPFEKCLNADCTTNGNKEHGKQCIKLKRHPPQKNDKR